MQLPDRMTVREAAQRAGLKYARATALYREMRAERTQIMQTIPVTRAEPRKSGNTPTCSSLMTTASLEQSGEVPAKLPSVSSKWAEPTKDSLQWFDEKAR